MKIYTKLEIRFYGSKIVHLFKKQWYILLAIVTALQLSSTLSVQAAGVINVTTTTDEYNTVGSGTGCSLREAIESANTDTNFGGCTRSGTPPYTIEIPTNTYLITLNPNPGSESNNQEDDFDILTSLNINGAGADYTIIDGSNLDRVFDINPLSNSGITIFISNITVQNGGVINMGTVLTLTNVAVKDSDIGFGFYNAANAGLKATSTLNNVTVSGNKSAGILNKAITADAILNLNNVTLSDNSWSGLINDANGSYNSVATLNNSTVTNNSTESGGGGIRRTGNSGSVINIKNTIIAGNKNQNSITDPQADCSGTVISQGYNLVGNNTGCSSNGTGDQTVNPSTVFTEVLGLLEDNSGATQTHALLIGSPAVNAGNPVGCTDNDNNPLLTDQRGIIRPQGIRCDIGAYEAQAKPSLSKTVDNVIPIRGHLITYTLTISNNGALTATNVLISDTLPLSMTFAGPLRLFPSNTILPSPTSSILADDLTITPGQQISLTFPVTINIGVAEGTLITNTASVTSTEVITPVADMVKITVAYTCYQPIILKK